MFRGSHYFIARFRGAHTTEKHMFTPQKPVMTHPQIQTLLPDHDPQTCQYCHRPTQSPGTCTNGHKAYSTATKDRPAGRNGCIATRKRKASIKCSTSYAANKALHVNNVTGQTQHQNLKNWGNIPWRPQCQIEREKQHHSTNPQNFTYLSSLHKKYIYTIMDLRTKQDKLKIIETTSTKTTATALPLPTFIPNLRTRDGPKKQWNLAQLKKLSTSNLSPMERTPILQQPHFRIAGLHYSNMEKEYTWRQKKNKKHSFEDHFQEKPLENSWTSITFPHRNPGKYFPRAGCQNKYWIINTIGGSIQIKTR